ncbi:MAG: response regulator [Thermodesulfovibrionales bacterium]
MTKNLRILLVEDNPGDANLIEEMLSGPDVRFEVKNANRLAAGIDYLKHNPVDAVIVDLGLPDSQGLDSFRKIYNENPKIPILVMTGLTDETIGIQAVQEGAQDYLIKGTVDGKLLARIIRFAIERKQIIDERDMLITQLREAAEKIKTLRGVVPICSYCKQIRNDKGFWERIEIYVRNNTEAEFSHGLCPECAEKAMNDFKSSISIEKRNNLRGK